MLNHIDLQGRLTADPQARTMSSGKTCVNFTLAVDRDFTDKSTGKRECDFIDCVAWGATADFINRYFVKGQAATVSGRLQIRTWTDKNGNNRRNAEVNVNNIYFAGEKKKEPEEPGADDFDYTEDSGDLPF